MAPCAEIPMLSKKSPRVSKVKKLYAPVSLPCRTSVFTQQDPHAYVGPMGGAEVSHNWKGHDYAINVYQTMSRQQRAQYGHCITCAYIAL